MIINTSVVMIGIAILATAMIVIALTIQLDKDECTDIGMQHAISAVLAINSALLATAITYLILARKCSSADLSASHSLQAVSILGIVLGGISLYFSVVLLNAAGKPGCKSAGKAGWMLGLSIVILVGGIAGMLVHKDRYKHLTIKKRGKKAPESAESTENEIELVSLKNSSK